MSTPPRKRSTRRHRLGRCDARDVRPARRCARAAACVENRSPWRVEAQMRESPGRTGRTASGKPSAVLPSRTSESYSCRFRAPEAEPWNRAVLLALRRKSGPRRDSHRTVSGSGRGACAGRRRLDRHPCDRVVSTSASSDGSRGTGDDQHARPARSTCARGQPRGGFQRPTPPNRSGLMRVTNPGGGFGIGGNTTSGPR